jgi:hypothetical protein
MKPRLGNSERGAALVEMAVILPLFVLMIFGMIEAGWAFAQANDVRHGAREGARMAAINDLDDIATITADVCSRMELSGSPETAITLTPIENNDDGEGGRNAKGRVLVELEYSSITGVVDFAFGGLTIRSDIDYRIEQPVSGEAAWWTEVGGVGFSSGSVKCP